MPTRILVAYALIALFVLIGAAAAWWLTRRRRPTAERWFPRSLVAAAPSRSISAIADHPATSGPNIKKD